MPAAMTKAPTQRTTCPATALKILATIFAMTAMVRPRMLQFKMPRPDAYIISSIWR